MSRTDAAIRAAAGVTVVALAGIAGAISYSHMIGLAGAHGEQGWRTHAFPLSVDGVEVVASLVLLADRRAGRRSGWLPWTALVVGTAASFAANVAVGGSDWIGRAVSGWPAFALLTAVKLLFGLLDRPPASAADAARTIPAAAHAADRPQAQPRTVPAAPGADRDETGSRPDVPDVRQSGPDSRDGLGHRADGGQAVPNANYPRSGERRRAGRPSTVLPTFDVSTLLPAARTARTALARNGQSLSREALARQLRADGHAASNARISAVLKALAAESYGADEDSAVPAA